MPIVSRTYIGNEPIDLTLAKAHLRIVGTEEDTLLPRYIAAARAEAELVSRRLLRTSTVVLELNGFPVGSGWLRVEPGPMNSVSQIQYVDLDGVTQTLGLQPLQVVAGVPGYVGRGSLIDWPGTAVAPRAVTVTYNGGYATSAVPEHLLQAMLLILGDLYENRERAAMGQGNSVAISPAARSLLHIERYT